MNIGPDSAVSLRRRLSAEARAACRTPGFIEFERGAIEQSIPDRFAAQVRTRPDAPAIKDEGEVLSYAELDRCANRVAHGLLAKLGPEPEPVALLIEQGAASVIATLAVLKAGKFYVPLDPSHPPARNQLLLENAGARLVLARGADAAAGLLDGGRDWFPVESAAELPPTDPGIRTVPDAYAYIIYTSGSSGQPKGVVQTHRNVLHLLRNYTNGLGISSQDRLSLLYPPSASAGMMDTFAALLNGACLCPYRVWERGVEDLAAWVARERITVYHSVSTLFSSWMATLASSETLNTIRVVDFGGEQVHQRHVEFFQQHFPPHSVLVNGYGGTEINVVRQYFADRRTECAALVPIGYPVEDTEVLLVDEEGREAAEGEIVVESGYLSPGYWRDPGQTAAVFRPSPRGNGWRRYHTGDLGRLDPDGCLTHLGRRDLQVKIRGFRVEVAEIECALCQRFGFQEAVVTARGENPDQKRLVASLVAKGGDAPSPDELRRGLAEVLPGYMIPSTFEFLEKLPRLPGGKTDRRTLAGSSPPRSGPARNTGPRTPLEAAVARIWGEVLGGPTPDIDDDFFASGGDSLSGSRVLARIWSEFAVHLSPRALFDSPTVAALAQTVAERIGKPEGDA